MMIRIDRFPSYVISKAEFDSEPISAYGAEWYINIRLYKYCQTDKKHIHVTPSSPDQPETLAAFVCGRRSDRKECSFDVDATFKFKQPTTAQENRFSHKFVFDSTNQHYDSWGSYGLAGIDVIFVILLAVILLALMTINFRIFWTSAMAIWPAAHLKCSSMSPFLSVDRFSVLPRF